MTVDYIKPEEFSTDKEDLMSFGTKGRNDVYTYIIAEIGINHMGNMGIAEQMIKAAAKAGADAVKFQKRDIVNTYTRKMLNQNYNSENSFGQTYGSHRHNLEFAYNDYKTLMKYCTLYGIEFLCTPWDEQSVDVLERLGVSMYKIASADLTNLPLLKKIAKLKKPMIISTGMATFDMIDEAVKTVHNEGNFDIALLYCVSSYPTNFDDISIYFMDVYNQRYPKCTIGYSGHELGLSISTAMVARGARIIERHITLDRSFKGSDQKSSLEIGAFGKLCRDIRIVNQAMSIYPNYKYIYPDEEKSYKKLGKSIVSAREIPVGKILDEKDIILKSPGIGLNYLNREKLLGKAALKRIEKDELLYESDFS